MASELIALDELRRLPTGGRAITEENAGQLVQEFVTRQLPCIASPEFEGQGIVIAAGGARLSINAWVNIRMLRRSGCSLPIQCWYLGEKERDENWIELVRPYGVECIDAHQVRKQHPHLRLNGWELKPFAITWSPFREVLFLDADNVAVGDPTYLFHTPEYLAHGAIFWPDYGRLGRDRAAWKVFGDIEYRDEPEFESGQIVVDKSKCWRPLQLVHWYMQNSNNFFFNYVHGDKEVFHLAWRRLHQEYAMVPRPICSLPGVMCQHDFSGKRIFQHRNMRKWSLGHNPETPGFDYEQECRDYLAELKRLWNPIQRFFMDLSEQDKATMSALTGRRFAYIRIGHDHRTLVLDSRGLVGDGAGDCETFWWCEGPQLVLVASDGTVTCRFQLGFEGVWFGRWEVHERMAAVLAPLATK